MTDRTQLLEPIKSLNPVQYEELLFCIGAPLEYLPSKDSPLVKQAIELLRYAEQTPDILRRQQEYLDRRFRPATAAPCAWSIWSGWSICRSNSTPAWKKPGSRPSCGGNTLEQIRLDPGVQIPAADFSWISDHAAVAHALADVAIRRAKQAALVNWLASQAKRDSISFHGLPGVVLPELQGIPYADAIHWAGDIKSLHPRFKTHEPALKWHIQNRLYSFRIPELDEAKDATPIRAAPKLRPVVVITSNSEKHLPDPFLRRCVYYNIPFPLQQPDPKQPQRQVMRDIIRAQTGVALNGVLENPAFLEDALSLFYAQRREQVRKPPSTAELLAWLYRLRHEFKAELANEKPFTDPARPLAGAFKNEKNRISKDLGILLKVKEDLEKEMPRLQENWARERGSK
jgi:hypothetical protein